MNENDETKIEVIEGAGGNAAVSDEELKLFKNEIDEITRDAGYSLNLRRTVNEDTRFCRWEGQSPDGRKHADQENGKPAFPFEGASDARVREADKIVNERVALLVTAALRADVAVKGADLLRGETAARMKILLDWVLRNQLEGAWRRELTRLANYQEGDSPGGGVLGIYWQQQWALQNGELTMEQVAAVLTNFFKVPPEQVQTVMEQLLDPANEDQTAQLFQTFVPDIEDTTARQVVRDLRETGKATFPSPYLRLNVPRVCAHRLNEDIFFPAQTSDLQRSRCIFVREWLTRVEVEERKKSYGYSESFVEEVLKHEGETAFLEYRLEVTGIVHETPQPVLWDKYQHRGMFEVITVYHKAVNDAGIPGIYTVTFSKFVDEAAGERTLLDYKHGKYPFVYFSSEILTARLLDSRGVPELIQTDQLALKVLHDSFADHTALSTVPPIKVPRRRPGMQLVIGPLKLIKEDRPGDVEFMNPPQYPTSNEKQQEILRRRINEYFHRMTAENLPELVRLMNQFKVDTFLDGVKEALMQLLQLCQQYYTDEDVANVTGDDGTQIGRTTKDIQGKFNLELSFDTGDVNLDFVEKKIGMIAKVLSLDTLNTVQRDRLVAVMLRAIDPTLARIAVMPLQAAQQKEADDEENNFAKISAGVEPPMVDQGQNFQLRLDVLQGITKKNPEALQKLTPVSRAIYEARLKHLAGQVQQQENAVTGRNMAQSVLGG